MTTFEFKLKENYPEMFYLCSIWNRNVIQGGKAKATVIKKGEEYYLHLVVNRCRKYSFLELNVPIVPSSLPIMPIIRGIIILENNNTLMLKLYQTYSEVKPVKIEDVKATEKVTVDKLLYIKLKEQFTETELKEFVDVFNLLLIRTRIHAHIRILKKLKVEFVIQDNEMPFVKVGFCLSEFNNPEGLAMSLNKCKFFYELCEQPYLIIGIIDS